MKKLNLIFPLALFFTCHLFYGQKIDFEEYDLDYNNETVIRRELKYDGNSRSFINDTPVKLNILNIVVVCLYYYNRWRFCVGSA